MTVEYSVDVPLDLAYLHAYPDVIRYHVRRWLRQWRHRLTLHLPAERQLYHLALVLLGEARLDAHQDGILDTGL